MKKFMKSSLIIPILVLSVLLIPKNVLAEEYYYVNQNGVSFTREAYDFFTEFFYDGYQQYMTQEMFDEYDDIDFATAEIEKVGMCPNQASLNPGNQLSPQDLTYYGTYAKDIEMGKVCGIVCRVSSVVTWHGVPNVQSHDVIGSYITGPTRVSTPIIMISSSAGGGFEDAMVYDTDGYGAVVSLPNADDIVVSQSFIYTGTGAIFMSYQHAVSTISLQNAQNFTIGLSGYGNVFQFHPSIADVYDQMNGVYMVV